MFKAWFAEAGGAVETLMFREARGRMLTSCLLKAKLISPDEDAGKMARPEDQVRRYIDLGGCVEIHPRMDDGELLIPEGGVSPATFFVYQGQLMAGNYAPQKSTATPKVEDTKKDEGAAVTSTTKDKPTPRESSTPRMLGGAADMLASAKKAVGIKSGERRTDFNEDAEEDAGKVRVIKAGSYVGELGLLKNVAAPEALHVGPGLVLLAADGQGFKELVNLVPTFRAHVALRVVDPERAGYDAVVNFSKANDLLHEHQKSEYAEEAWLFWRDSSAWVKEATEAEFHGMATEEHKASMLEKAQELMETYVKEGSMQQINIPSDCQKRLLAIVEKGEIDKTLWDEARQEMRKLVERDTLPRFRKGEKFKQLVKELGAYAEELQFENEDAFVAGIERAEQQALAFPTYAHSLVTQGDWTQFEVDM